LNWLDQFSIRWGTCQERIDHFRFITVASAVHFGMDGHKLRKVVIPVLLLLASASALGYQNPVIYADYSDPDVIRSGDDYYLVASSFTCQPGIPVLHSKDLVNWTIINHIYTTLPFSRYQKPQHGQGSWAPSIR